jgi:hypothetical protein
MYSIRKDIIFFSMTMVAAFVMACSCDKDHGIVYPKPSTDTTSTTVSTKPKDVGNKVVAHRGGASESNNPDNSLASLKYAISLNCFASECDIYWTSDNDVVVAHATNGCLINGLTPWDHTIAELRAAGKLSNGEELPDLAQYLDVVQKAGTTRLWLDVKLIQVDGTTAHTDMSIKACQRACEIIASKKAENFVNFIVTGNGTVWAGAYSAAMKAGIKAGWMAYRNPTDYLSYSNPWANLSVEYIYQNGTAAGNAYSIEDFLNSKVQLSFYNVDTDADRKFYLQYYDRLYAICTNYPSKLLNAIAALK